MIPAALLPASGRAVVLVDGGSGSGKTTLAQGLADAWPGPIEVVSLDSLYPSWYRPAAAAEVVAYADPLPGHPARARARRPGWCAGCRLRGHHSRW